MIEHIEIGRIIGTHGLEGSVMIQVHTSYIPLLAKGNFIFINVAKDTPIPFQITNMIKTGSAIEKIISLKRINTIEDAKKINGSIVSVHESQVQHSHKAIIKEKLLGYIIKDDRLGSIGTIRDIIETPHQRLAEIIYHDQDVLIPLVDDFILQIRHKEKEILMNLPDGLINI